MKIIEEQKHFLALQTLPGDNRYIDISKLSIANHYMPTSLAQIDSFTMHFTTEQIMAAIKEANIVEEKYLLGTLCICDNQKHNSIPVISKEFLGEFSVEQFISSCLGNKELINTIVSKFSALVDDQTIQAAYKKALISGFLEQALHTLFSIPYLIQRKYIIYLIELDTKLKRKEKNKMIELTRDKAA